MVSRHFLPSNDQGTCIQRRKSPAASCLFLYRLYRLFPEELFLQTLHQLLTELQLKNYNKWIILTNRKYFSMVCTVNLPTVSTGKFEMQQVHLYYCMARTPMFLLLKWSTIDYKNIIVALLGTQSISKYVCMAMDALTN